MPKSKTQPLNGIVIRQTGSEWYTLEVLTADGKPLAGVSALRVEWNGRDHCLQAHLTVLDPRVEFPLAPHQVRIAVTDIDGNPLVPERSAEGLMTAESGEAG